MPDEPSTRTASEALASQPADDVGATAAWRLAFWLVGAITAITLTASVLALPVQVSDSLVPLLQAEPEPSVLHAAVASASSTGYFRPLRIAQIQALYELSAGRHFTTVFRWFHGLWVLALFACVLALMRVRTGVDCCVGALALTVAVGHHAFLGTVWEAYPINHFLEIGVLCLFALVLAQSHGGWWVDALAAVTFVVATGTLESGLLVWVVVAAAWLSGWRGVSARTVLVLSGLLVVYGYARFSYFASDLPGLTERESGFWTARLSPSELEARFAANPIPFYAYNVAASFMGLLFAEPRAGVFTIPLQMARDGRLDAATWLNTVSSLLVSMCIIWGVARRAPAWLAGRFDDASRLLFVASAVIAANAVISYGYTKDEIMSPAGLFYALAAFVGVRDVVRSNDRGGVRLLVTACLVVAALGWTTRAIGTHYRIHRMAFTDREQWLDVDAWLTAQQAGPKNDEQRRIVEVLRQDALARTGLQPALFPAWADEWFR